MPEIKLTDFQGFFIRVSSYNGKFNAYEKDEDKDPIFSETTLEELQEKIKRHNSNKRRFKPLKVIQIESDKVGRITSRVADCSDMVYFTHKPSPKERANRTKCWVVDRYGWKEPKDPRFALATEENLATLAKIENIKKAIQNLSDKAKALRKTYKDAVTMQTLDQDEGKGGM